MNASSYKDFKTSRGLNYHYYLVAPGDKRKPTVLLVHGFPSTSYDWHNQAKHLSQQGFGVLVPDLLGYGGTDKPTKPEMYRMSLMCKDIVDILDHERLKGVVAVGHDWGCALVSRLFTYFPKYFRAYGFLSLGFVPLAPTFDLEEALELHRKNFNSELFGYFSFFNEDDAHELLARNFDSFFTVLYPADPTLFTTVLAPQGMFKSWVQQKKVAPLPAFLNESEKKKRKDTLLRGGLAGPLCWYKALVRKLTPKEEANLENTQVQDPVLFIAGRDDYINLSEVTRQITHYACPNATIHELGCGHWMQLEKPEEVNALLTDWLNKLK